MKASHKLRPIVEGVESKALPSSGLAGVAPVHLDGTAQGVYVARQANPDFPRDYNVLGSGRLGLSVRSTVRGQIDEGGFTTNPGPHGNLTVTDRRGTLRLVVTSRGPDAQDDTADYTIVGGTGVDRHATGHGTVTFTFTPAPGTSPPTPRHPLQRGHFTMVFAG